VTKKPQGVGAGVWGAFAPRSGVVI
jgi:hypothetical protein